jgi:N-sulfoglucosamine sulfohydrolase
MAYPVTPPYLKMALNLLLFCALNALGYSATQPNILWIITEDMSPDFGCYGNDAVTTPNIDRLASRGMIFNQVHTTGPACSPSRTAMATGVYQTTLGAFHMRYSDELLPALPAHVKLLPQLLREVGYSTGNLADVDETGTAKDDWLFKAPADVWDSDSWDELVLQQPFYAQINTEVSHRPFSRDSKVKVDPRKLDIPPYYPDHEVSQEDWIGYLEEVNRTDELVGNILAHLEHDGLTENTIVILVADHGRPMIRAKNWLYDTGTRVPMIVFIPPELTQPSAYSAGTENSELISGVDLVAETLLLAGAEIPDWVQGRSFLRADSVPRDYIFTAVDRIGNIDSRSRAIRSERFKYIRNYKTPGSINQSITSYRMAMHPIHHLLNLMGEHKMLTPIQARLLEPIAEEELYDLASDPHEIHNLIGRPAFASIHDDLRQRLDDWIVESGDLGFEPDSDAIVTHFKVYGEKTAISNRDKIEVVREQVRARVAP